MFITDEYVCCKLLGFLTPILHPNRFEYFTTDYDIILQNSIPPIDFNYEKCPSELSSSLQGFVRRTPEDGSRIEIKVEDAENLK